MLRARKVAWEDPEKSIGRKVTTSKGRTIWEATGPAAGIFENELFGIIDRLLQEHKEEIQSGEKTSQTISFHLWMVGREARSARPTIIFTCKSPTYRTKVIRLLKQNNILEDFPGMALRSMDRMPAEPMSGRHNRLQLLDGLAQDPKEIIIYSPACTINSCGTSIFVGNNHEATLGGVLLINGIYYGFTSLHPRNNENCRFESLVGEGGNLAFDEDSDSPSTRTQSLRSIRPSLTNLSIHRSSLDLISIDSRTANDGKNAKQPSHAETFPANFRRIGALRMGDAQRMLDYDIFPIEDPELHMGNRIPLPRVPGHPQEFLNTETILTKVVESRVFIATGRSGVIKGTIMNNPYFIKMAGSESYQKMWPVELEKDIVPGDCGSWVVDARSGGLYGHIVAGDASLHRAFIIPAIDVVHDIQTRFKHDVILPNIFTVRPNSSGTTQPAKAEKFSSYFPPSATGNPVVTFPSKAKLSLPSYEQDGNDGITFVKAVSTIWKDKLSSLRHFTRSQPTFPGLYNKIRPERIEDYPHGYPRLAAVMNSSNDFTMFRRFGTLHMRSLLHLQAELSALEQELKDLDNADALNPETSLSLYSHRRAGDSDPRIELLYAIRSKLKDYDDLLLQHMKLKKRHKPSKLRHQDLFNYMTYSRPVTEEDEQFILHRDDLVCMEEYDQYSWLDNVLKRSFWRIFMTSKKESRRSFDPLITFLSEVRILSSLVSFIFVIIFVLVPNYLLVSLRTSPPSIFAIFGGFVFVFAITFSGLTELKRFEILIFTAAYGAFLASMVADRLLL